jgi:hypothetical protein
VHCAGRGLAWNDLCDKSSLSARPAGGLRDPLWRPVKAYGSLAGLLHVRTNPSGLWSRSPRGSVPGMLTLFFYRRALRIMAGDLGVRPRRLARDLERLPWERSIPAGKIEPPAPNPVDIELLTRYLQERRER